MKKADIGLVGLAVMGENLALNMESKGFCVAVFNRTVATVDKFVSGRGAGKQFIATHSLEQLVDSLSSPRRIFLMIKAGNPVDVMIDTLIPLLDKGDIIIDGGNSNFNDTIRRTQYVESKGLLYLGAGVSGGEEGALKGPSIMPGGSQKAYEQCKHILQSICAKADGEPCCQYVGDNGAGHYVKMVHNGIEYGDMQLICECYDIMQRVLKLSSFEAGEIFAKFNQSKLESYLIEITANILRYKEGDEVVVEKILDRAGQKGTGKWACISALDAGIPLTIINEAVYARSLSALLSERQTVAEKFDNLTAPVCADKQKLIEDISEALYAAKIMSYAQGYSLLRQAAQDFNWKLNFGEIALMWRGGCIIRSIFLGKIKQAYDTNPNLENLLLDDFFASEVKHCQASLRNVCKIAIDSGIAIPTLSSALAYFDGYRSRRLPANLLQAQRDYFGAHTYERVDKPAGEHFHTNWTGEGGNTTSNEYNA